MVETSLRPRPCFYTFLDADSAREGDALTYSDYQRALRSKKVEILQQRRAVTYEPGYNKPYAMHPARVTRKVFQLKNKFPFTDQFPTEPVQPASEQLHRPPCAENTASNNDLGSGITSALEPVQSKAAQPFSGDGKAMENTSAQVNKLPRIAKPRLVKSATARDHTTTSAVVSPPLIPQRPKTAANTRDSQIQTAHTQEGHHKALSEGSKLCKGDMEREELCKSYQWGTSTQRNCDDVKWVKRYSLPSSFLPATTVEQFPDPVSQRLTFRRYNSEPAGWQTFGTDWDYVQTRPCNTFIKGPQAFCSSSPNTEQIPGYSGYIPGLGVFDDDKRVDLSPITLVRTVQPRKTKISKRANIPGYTGQVHWTNSAPAHSDMPIPEPTTSARVHRHIPLEDELSPFRKEAVLARMVTTVSPYNPFNKIEF